MKSELVKLLRECADALYYVFECGDSRVFHNDRYEELALRCDEMVRRLRGQELQDILVEEVLKDYEEVEEK